MDGADSADHLVPVSLGGSDKLANLRAVHHNVEPKCNRRRGAGDIAEIREQIITELDDARRGYRW